MKTPEDEAFDELAKRQGAWGGGYQSKRKMAADKLHWSDCAVHNAPAYPAGECDCGVAQEPLIDRLRKTASKGVSAWGDLMLEAADALARPAQESVAFICQGNLYMAGDVDKYCTATHIPLYSAPPQRPWVGLTDEEMYLNCPNWLSQEQCKAWIQQIEAKLKEKNNGT
jgi:hypothetical protein